MRLKPVNPNPPQTGYDSPGYLRQRWLQKGEGHQAPSYVNLVLTLRFLSKVPEGEDRRTYVMRSINDIFNQTSLRRFEFLDAISYAIENGHLDEKLFDVHPFRNELHTFETCRNTVITYRPDTKYAENIGLLRLVA